MSSRLKRVAKPLLACALALGPAAPAAPQELAPVRVNAFPTASYSPLYLGIANAAVDNAVAMVELAKQDAVIVTGGDTGMNELIVRPEIGSIADIRGKNLVVDAPNTAYALLAKKVLKNEGLLDGRDYALKPIGGTPQRLEAMEKSADNAAAMLNPPFSFAAKDRGLKSFGRAIDLLGPYQAGGAFVMRGWARANAPLLERYIAAYIESVRMTMAPESRAQVVSLISTRFKQDQKVARSEERR